MVPGDGVMGSFLVPGDGVMGPFFRPLALDCSPDKYRSQGLPRRQRTAPSVLSLDSGIYLNFFVIKAGREMGYWKAVGSGL